ncbi:hypothetical protein BS297_24155 [Rhodococcus erythropolis]|uniref:histidine kinase n=1 Tax=Rhodococcus erythropolis TaxID=1833 RepID=A0A5N5DXC4_RHOER|nr:hypothetical protein BS297_24155 [Rhodococcus erythropolis]
MNDSSTLAEATKKIREKDQISNTRRSISLHANRTGVFVVGILSLAYLVITALIGDSFPKDIESRLDYWQLLGPTLIIILNALALPSSGRHPFFFFFFSVTSMVVLALALGDRAAAVTPLYWLSIFLLSLRTQGILLYLSASLGAATDILVSVNLQISGQEPLINAVTFVDNAIQPIINVTVSYAFVITIGKIVQTHQKRRRIDTVKIEQLQFQRESDIKRAVAEERARMARELHDVSAHHLTAVIIQGKAAVEVFDTNPREVPPLLSGVVDEGERALRSLRQLVEVLRIDPTASQSPQPSIQSLRTLIDGCERAGLKIQSRTSEGLYKIDSAIQMSCYRIVQESLSNVLRHSPGSNVKIVIENILSVLYICIENETTNMQRSTDGQGLGLVGIRERTELLGGSFKAGMSIEGNWTVQAKIPLREEH